MKSRERVVWREGGSVEREEVWAGIIKVRVFFTCTVGTEASQKFKADVLLHAHLGSMDLENVTTTLREAPTYHHIRKM